MARATVTGKKLSGKGSEFVTITLEQFDNELLRNEPGKLKCQRVYDPKYNEWVYQVFLNQRDYPNLAIWVFSSIKIRGTDAELSRDYGDDAIRLVVINLLTGKVIGSSSHTKRTKGWEVRLKDKIREMILSIYASPACKCGRKTILKTNKTDNTEFWGCQYYGNGCTNTGIRYDTEWHENQINLLRDKLEQLRKGK